MERTDMFSYTNEEHQEELARDHLRAQPCLQRAPRKIQVLKIHQKTV
jgi:hypothetical protein